MRAGLAAAVLATLTLAAPAAAQPTGPEVLREAVETLDRSHGPAVTDYSLTLVRDDLRVPVYVERGEDEWVVHGPENSMMGDLMAMAVMWPQLVVVGDDPDRFDELGKVRYVGAETVEGRRTHVVAAPPGAEFGVDNVDSLTVYVDAETSHILRFGVAGTMPDEGGPFGGGRMRLGIDMLDHRETDGVVVPRRLRVRMAMDLPEMEPAERAQMTLGIAAVQMQLQGSDDPEAKEMLAAIELFSSILSGGELDLPMTVEDVVVNGGRPDWLDEQ